MNGYYVCSNCGSENIMHDAFVSWNKKNQDFEIVNMYEKGGFCNDCEKECRAEWKEEEEAKS